MKSVVPGILSVLALAAAPSLARNFTVINACPYTIWPAIFTDSSAGAAVPGIETGWEAVPKSSRSFSVPDNWRAGRIWARSECSFTSAGSGTCVTGSCAGGVTCTSPPIGPVTTTEWTLSGSDAIDWYAVSLVDGFNIPVKITNNQGCAVADCPVDLNANCPSPLKGPAGASGDILGCQSACGANLDGTPDNSKNCCTGQYATPSTCPPSGVQYYSYFKNACPRAYAFVYDDSTSTLVCPSSKKADYTITFCP